MQKFYIFYLPFLKLETNNYPVFFNSIKVYLFLGYSFAEVKELFYKE